ncbi:MAG TPA: Mur ligase family protein, partial [Candidatus Kapabacteria bacterium]
MNITTKDLLQVKHLSSELTSKIKFSNVSTDSRTVKKGDLFIALRGEKFDGHEFIAQVAKQGAKAAIVDAKWFRKTTKRPKLNYLVVKDTTQAMGELARLYRLKFEIPILAIGGSNGKTTTKELVAHVLGTSFNVLKTEANFNNQVGVPQMLFRITSKHEIAVLEIGTNHPGEIAWLTNVIEPTHTLITNIGREHLEFFKNLDGVAKEETSAFFISE